MKKWLKKKPVRFAVLVGFLNMELVVIPIILKGCFKLSGLSLKIGAVLWSSAEIFFWYWFAGWVFKKVKESKPVQEAIVIGKESAPEVKDRKSEIRNTEFVKKVEGWVVRHIIEPFSPENQTTKKASLFIKSCGYVFGLPAMFVLGLIPGLWIPGLVFCRAINSKIGFAAIVSGNMVKNVLFAEGWDFVWKFF